MGSSFIYQVGCMRQVLGPGTIGRPRGIGWRGRWEGGSGWGIRVNPWLIHVNVWQNPLQYCKVISLQLIKINEKKKKICLYLSECNSLSHIGEGNGNPLQCSCLENPRDGGAWWAAVYEVAQGWTRLKWLNSSSSSWMQAKICDFH